MYSTLECTPILPLPRQQIDHELCYVVYVYISLSVVLKHMRRLRYSFLTYNTVYINNAPYCLSYKYIYPAKQGSHHVAFR